MKNRVEIENMIAAGEMDAADKQLRARLPDGEKRILAELILAGARARSKKRGKLGRGLIVGPYTAAQLGLKSYDVARRIGWREKYDSSYPYSGQWRRAEKIDNQRVEIWQYNPKKSAWIFTSEIKIARRGVGKNEIERLKKGEIAAKRMEKEIKKLVAQYAPETISIKREPHLIRATEDIYLLDGNTGEKYHLSDDFSARENFKRAIRGLSKRRKEIVKKAEIMEQAKSCFVALDDSVRAGNCLSGSQKFIAEHHLLDTLHPVGAIRGDILLGIEDSGFTRRAIVAALSRVAV